MVILKNIYLSHSNPKTNCLLGTIDTFLVVTVKMFYMYSLAITVTFSILDKLTRKHTRQRTRKHKSGVIHSDNSNCKKCPENLRTCSRMKEPYFNICRFLNEENRYLREFKERQYNELGAAIKFLSTTPLYTLAQI